MFVTILSRGFQIMFAMIILALSGGAILLAMAWLALFIHDGGLHQRKISPEPVVSADCLAALHRDPKMSEGQKILEAYRCWP
jgi:hypothetical protein